MSMHTELLDVIPNGIGFVPFRLPGTVELANASLKAFAEHDIVLWEKHGCYAIGADVHDAFDLTDIVVKAAGIYLQCMARTFTLMSVAEFFTRARRMTAG